VSPQPATPLAPRLAARDGLSPARRRRQAAVKSPARGPISARVSAGGPGRGLSRPQQQQQPPFSTSDDDDDDDDMADAAYAIADERARDARRAGLQAKKDEQPANTARSYRSKQEEWKARPRPPPFLERTYRLTRGSVDLVPDAARRPRRLALQLAGRRARHARQARGVA